MLTLIRGLPGQGKSTLAREMLANSEVDVHFETDMFFEFNEGQYFYDQNRIGEAHNWCQHETQKALDKGLRVVVSNTFTQLWEMQKYMQMGEFKIISLIQAPIRKNSHNVPDYVIEKMIMRWED